MKGQLFDPYLSFSDSSAHFGAEVSGSRRAGRGMSRTRNGQALTVINTSVLSQTIQGPESAEIKMVR